MMRLRVIIRWKRTARAKRIRNTKRTKRAGMSNRTAMMRGTSLNMITKRAHMDSAGNHPIFWARRAQRKRVTLALRGAAPGIGAPH